MSRHIAKRVVCIETIQRLFCKSYIADKIIIRNNAQPVI